MISETKFNFFIHLNINVGELFKLLWRTDVWVWAMHWWKRWHIWYEWMQKQAREGNRGCASVRATYLSVSEQLPGCLYVCLYRCLYRCVPLLARATAWLPASAWESAFTAPPCSTRPRQACPFLPLQRQYNHQMTQTTQFSKTARLKASTIQSMNPKFSQAFVLNMTNWQCTFVKWKTIIIQQWPKQSQGTR